MDTRAVSTTSTPLGPQGFPALRRIYGRISAGRTLTVLSLVFGIVGPIVCFAVGTRLLLAPSIIPVCYAFVAVEIAALAFWLRFGGRTSARTSGLLSGMLAAGAMASFPIAMLLGYLAVGFTIGGLFDSSAPRRLEMLGLALLGYVPAGCCFVFYRQMVLARRRARELGSHDWPVLAGFLLPLALAWAGSRAVLSHRDEAASSIYDGGPMAFEDAVARLRRMKLCFDNREMERRWRTARSDTPKADRISEAYSQITGRRIQQASD